MREIPLCLPFISDLSSQCQSPWCNHIRWWESQKQRISEIKRGTWKIKIERSDSSLQAKIMIKMTNSVRMDENGLESSAKSLIEMTRKMMNSARWVDDDRPEYFGSTQEIINVDEEKELLVYFGFDSTGH